MKSQHCFCILDPSVVNFINILCALFSYESALRSFSLITAWLCYFLAIGYWQKNIEKNVVEIDPLSLMCEIEREIAIRDSVNEFDRGSQPWCANVEV